MTCDRCGGEELLTCGGSIPGWLGGGMCGQLYCRDCGAPIGRTRKCATGSEDCDVQFSEPHAEFAMG